MRKEETITIDGQAVTVREMCVSQLPAAVETFTELLTVDKIDSLSAVSWMYRNIQKVIDIFGQCTSLGDDILKLGGEDYVEIVEAFARVNAGFFVRVRRGLKKIAENTKELPTPAP
ncbi:MAG: hypothetical protein RDU30_09920 [Desulfovibrionaceae bacterium]|nr:hypothetical protein [Desulfovibrionaceae bacterium]